VAHLVAGARSPARIRAATCVKPCHARRVRSTKHRNTLLLQGLLLSVGAILAQACAESAARVSEAETVHVASVAAGRPSGASAESTGPNPRLDADTELERTVQKAIAARGEELGVCYEKTLTDASPETSRVVFVIEIGRDGRASRVLEGRREGLSNEQVKCFARVLKARPFHDGASGDMRIQAPLAFVKKKSVLPATSARP
jgi:hypothetical protein